MGEIFISSAHEKVLKLIAIYGYVTVNEIALLMSDKRRAFNVLHYLFQKGYLGTFATGLQPNRAYYIPENIRTILESSGRVPYVRKYFPYLYRPTGFYHHINIIKVHILLEKILGEQLVEWVSEPQIKEQYQMKVCDGEMVFLDRKGQKKRAGIEVELTLKSKVPLARKVKNLLEYANKNLDVIIIFYSNEMIKKRTIETIKLNQQESTKPIFFIYLEDLYRDGVECLAETIDGVRQQVFR